MGLIKDVIGGVFSVIAKPLEEWQKRKTLKVKQEDMELERQHELNGKKLDIAFQLAKNGQKIVADWDTNAQQQMKYTWKDEYLTILFSIPLILAFIPKYQNNIEKGFEILEKTPDWYMFSVIGIVSATFGLRWLLGKVKR